MPRSVTVTFSDGTSHTYDGVPDTATPKDVNARASNDFKKSVTAVEAATPAAASAPSNAGEPVESKLGSLARAAYNTPRSVLDLGVDTAKGAYNAVAHPIDTAKGLLTTGFNAGKIVKGAVHTAIDDPSVGQTPDKAAYADFADENYRKYGNISRALRTFADNPAPVVTGVASLAVPALRAAGAGDVISGAASRLTAPVTSKVAASPMFSDAARIARSAKTAEVTGAAMRGGEESYLTDTALPRAAGQVTSTADAAASAARMAERRRAVSQVVAQRKAALNPALDPGLPEAGTSRLPTEIGESLRGPAQARADEIESGFKGADAQFRAAMEEVGNERAAAGEGVSDIPEAQALIQQSKDIVNPDPLKSQPVGYRPTAGIAKLHNDVIDTLSTKKTYLNAEQAAEATKNGVPVLKDATGQYVEHKPDLQTIDELRRHIGQVAQGNVEGYGAINTLEARKLQQQVSGVMDAYAEGTSADVQNNYAAGKQALIPYEKARAGKQLLGLQKGTDIHNVPASNIVDRMVGGGRDTIEQMRAVAGDAPVEAALRSHVQNTLLGLKKSSAIESAFAPGTQLADSVAAYPDLERAVADYTNRVRSSETAGQQAADLGAKANKYTASAQKYDKVAETLTGQHVQSVQALRKATQNLINLQTEVDPTKLSGRYSSMLEDAHTAGDITDQQYAAGKQLSNTAAQSFKDLETRNAWLRGAALTLGAAPVATHAMGAIGLPVAAAVGVGLGGRAVRRVAGTIFKGH